MRLAREGTDRTRFAQVMAKTPGKRLTYKALTEKSRWSARQAEC
jgi:hypothetical protein